MQEFTSESVTSQKTRLDRGNQLALSTATNPAMETLYNLRLIIRGGWRFYDSFRLSHDKIREPVLVEQSPYLDENAKNLSSVLHYLMTEHQSAFDEFQQCLRAAFPGFRRLKVKAYGAPGQVMAFWQEAGIDNELTLADLSDGVLNFVCWAALFAQPELPPLICIDEPTQGLHPRVFPILAEILEEASDRTQILLATHSSYLLKQFGLSQVAVMRKKDGAAEFIKPKNSKALVGILDDFGPEEIESLHRSDELEILA